MPFAAVGAVAAVGSTVAGVIGAGEQADATKSAQAAANAEQDKMYANAQQTEQPFIDAGKSSLTQQQNLLGLNGQDAATSAMSQFTASPGYQYQLNQGLSAVDNGAASRGEIRSGNTMRAEETLGSNLAGQDFANYFARLQNITGTGASAASTLTGAALGTGQGEAQTDTSAGNALSNIYGNQTAGISNALNSGASNLDYYGSKNGWFGSGSGSSGGAFTGSGTTNALFGSAPGTFASGIPEAAA